MSNRVDNHSFGKFDIPNDWKPVGGKDLATLQDEFFQIQEEQKLQHKLDSQAEIIKTRYLERYYPNGKAVYPDPPTKSVAAVYKNTAGITRENEDEDI